MPLMDWDFMDGYLKSSDVLLPPPGPVFSALFLALGLWKLGDLVFGRCFKGPRTGIEQAACFIGGCGVAGTASYLLAVAGLCSLTVLRFVGASFLILALFQIPPAMHHLHSAVERGLQAWQTLTAVQRVIVALLLAALLFAGLVSLAPATYIDALNYHLGVPLDWLRQGRMQAYPDWLHPRFAAHGEAINMLGLAMGTDAVGSLLQFVGLLILCVAAVSIAADLANAIFGLLLVVACPAMLALITDSKPMILPVAATTAALLLIRQPRLGSEISSWTMAIVCLSVAVATKHSFLLTADIVGGLLIYKAWRLDRLRDVLGIGLVCGAFFVLPLYLQNLRLYGDPLSPRQSHLNCGEIEEELFQDVGGQGCAVAFAAEIIFDQSVRREDGHCQSS